MGYSLFFLTTALMTASLIGQEKLPPQEVLFLKRIHEFWKDQDFPLVKSQITTFLKDNPQSSVHENLLAILGDLYFQEEAYADAASIYQKLEKEDLKRKIGFRYLQALKQEKKEDAVIEIASALLDSPHPSPVENENEVRSLLAQALFEKFQKSDSSDRKECGLKAKSLYAKLVETPYREASLYPLAELHRASAEFPQACRYYQDLLKTHPEESEKLLMVIASLQRNFDQESAIKTYEDIYLQEGENAQTAAYNQLVLLYQEKKFSDLVAKATLLEKKLAKDHLPLFHFCLGESYFSLEQWAEAARCLEAFLKEDSMLTEQRKAAYIFLISCSQKMGSPELFDRALRDLLTAYPKDEETAKALLLHAQAALERQDVLKAAVDLEQVLLTFPEHPQRETLLYDQALLFAQAKNWEKSRIAFLDFLKEFPQTSHLDLVWGYILNCSIQQLKESPLNQETKKQFAADLQTALEQRFVFTTQERPKYQYMLGKTLFELQNYEAAAQALEEAMNTYPDDPSAPNSHLLLAYCYREISPGSESFIFHAQKALDLNSKEVDKGSLHLQLFNAYLASHRFSEAATHLFSAFIEENTSISQENQIWLANYYWKEGLLDRARPCFEKLLKIENESMQLNFSVKEAHLESEALKFAQMLLPRKKVALLLSLSEMQQKHPTAPWRFHRQTLYELGKAYEALKETNQALQIYDQLIESSPLVSSYFASAAALEKARILYARIPDKERLESNPQVISILASLKDLQIQKRLVSEPIHLEAALEYADIRSQIAQRDPKEDVHLFYLKRMEEEFNNEEDPGAKEYHEARFLSPDKNHLFQMYMSCLKAEILRLESLGLMKEGNAEQAKVKSQTAASLLIKLGADPGLTPYLKTRVELNLKLL